MLKYPTHHYDENLLLRVSPLIWLSILYGVRHFFFMGAAKLMPMDVVALPWINLQTSPFFMLTDFPAVLVLLATGHRVSNGWNIMRRVWKHGRWLLIVSYGAGVAVFGYVNQETLLDPDAWNFADAMLVLIVDFACIGYLISSERVRDIFNDLPDSAEKRTNKSGTHS
jgi:hypothetical protein